MTRLKIKTYLCKIWSFNITYNKPKLWVLILINTLKNMFLSKRFPKIQVINKNLKIIIIIIISK